MTRWLIGTMPLSQCQRGLAILVFFAEIAASQPDGTFGTLVVGMSMPVCVMIAWQSRWLMEMLGP